MRLSNLKTTARLTGLSEHALRLGAIRGIYPFCWIGRKRMFCIDLVEEAVRQNMLENQRESAKAVQDVDYIES